VGGKDVVSDGVDMVLDGLTEEVGIDVTVD
jgi:hypothetical protein